MLVTTLGPLAVHGRPVRGDRLGVVIRELIDARGRAVSVAGGPGGYRLPPEQVRVDAIEASALVEQAREGLRTGDAAAARRFADQARALFPASPELDDPARIRLFAEVAAVAAEAALAGAGASAVATAGLLDAGHLAEADLRRLVAARPPHEPSADLRDGATVTVSGEDGETLGTGQLVDGMGTTEDSGVACAWNFFVPDVSGDRDGYLVEVTNRGRHRYDASSIPAGST